MSASSILGLAIMIASETATLMHVEPFWSWNTPLCWTGFILFADGIVFRASGKSWLRAKPLEFVLLAALSIPLWLVFEFYNLHIRNWYYAGLPTSPLLRLLGYAWSFATIWPAIFEAAELVSVLIGPGVPGRSTGCDDVDGRSPAAPASEPANGSTSGARALGPQWGLLSIAAGLAMLLCPFLVSPAVARYLAAPVWLGFIFLLDPINAWNGAPSLLVDIRTRSFRRIIELLASGLLCGFLWEFWNFWAGAKWHYTVPILENMKLFEMPLPGYLGFPAFALECFTMYVFVRSSAGTRCNFPLGTI